MSDPTLQFPSLDNLKNAATAYQTAAATESQLEGQLPKVRQASKQALVKLRQEKQAVAKALHELEAQVAAPPGAVAAPSAGGGLWSCVLGAWAVVMTAAVLWLATGHAPSPGPLPPVPPVPTPGPRPGPTPGPVALPVYVAVAFDSQEKSVAVAQIQSSKAIDDYLVSVNGPGQWYYPRDISSADFKASHIDAVARSVGLPAIVILGPKGGKPLAAAKLPATEAEVIALIKKTIHKD